MASTNSTGSTLERFGERIGKSLVKYLKPIRTVLPHFKEQKPTIQLFLTEDQQHKKNSEENKKASILKVPPRDFLQEEIDALEKEIQAQGKVTLEENSWLDSVLLMLKTCKKTALKMKRKKAISHYSSALQTRASGKFESRGTIVNLELGSLQFLASTKSKNEK